MLSSCLAVVLTLGCASTPTRLGAPVATAEALPLSELPELVDGESVERVVLRGRVGEVCRSAGCWLTLDSLGAAPAGDEAASFRQLHVDLKPSADFTVTRGLIGEQVALTGRLVRDGPDLALHAVGLQVLP
ncbi:MAG: hypothetical protein AAF533_07430 [Acidobacteriota bacterium]